MLRAVVLAHCGHALQMQARPVPQPGPHLPRVPGHEIVGTAEAAFCLPLPPSLSRDAVLVP